LLVASAVGVGAGVANAEPDYPPGFNQITASKFTVASGGSIVFKAQTFKSRSVVKFKVRAHGKVVKTGTVRANRKGVARRSIRFTVVGVNKVTFSGTSKRGRPLVLSTKITVKAKTKSGSGGATISPVAVSSGTSSAGGGLPVTGGQIAVGLLVGVLLLLGGGLLVAASRRRHT
jgi:LPXTG-motif cell wall-anchored protein